ncbi:MAG: translation elongation factor Ts [Ignavibacteriaceae bacterium]
MQITAAQVNDLRKKTGAGMMDCKKALVEANGDIEKAIEILRKKGAAVAAKRAEKSANEGLILTKVSDNSMKAAMVEINCETDFVAKSEDFTKFAGEVLEKVFQTEPENLEGLYSSAPDIKEKLSDLLGKVGEKIEISRFIVEKTDSGIIVDYVHMGSKLGVLVSFANVNSGRDELMVLGKDIAMQVAAMKPLTVKREDVPNDVIEKEMDIYKELARKEGKPENILEKIATGRLNKFYAENCLVEQAFIKDNTKTVGDLIKEFNKKHNSQVMISHFRRFHLSDEIK